MTDEEVMAAVRAWVARQPSCVPVEPTGAPISRPRSWIVVVEAVDRQPVLGQSPVIVDKETMRIRYEWDGWLEYLDELSVGERIRRWWNRMFLY